MSGLYHLEDNRWRWMARRGVVLLKSPAEAQPLRGGVRDPRPVARAAHRTAAGRPRGGGPDLRRPGHLHAGIPARCAPAGASATVEIVADKSFSVAGDRRELSIIVTGVGF